MEDVRLLDGPCVKPIPKHKCCSVVPEGFVKYEALAAQARTSMKAEQDVSFNRDA